MLGDDPVSAVNIKLIRLLGFEIWVGKHPNLVIFGKVNEIRNVCCFLQRKDFMFCNKVNYHDFDKFEVEVFIDFESQ